MKALNAAHALTDNRESTSVVLPYVDLLKMNETNFEPQEVTNKTPVSTWIYLTNLNKPSQTGVQVTLDAGGQVIFEKVSRVTPIGFILHTPNIPNVNVRNNTLTFYSSVTLSSYTVTIQEDLYLTDGALMIKVVSALNSVSGSSGLTFSYIAYPTPGSIARLASLSSAGGNFYIDPNCSAVKKGLLLYGFPVMPPVYVGSVVVGPINLLYTAYVDVCSYTLTKYAKLRSISTDTAKSAIFLRVPIAVSQTNFGVDSTQLFNREVNNNFAFRSKETVNSIDITLYDMFGDLLYVPPELVGKFSWTLTIAVQI